ncbi:MAG TPA: electron transfer flavoprotein subunit beta/FixA family protein [Candidatus Kapabacteria bacterium]|nr:electron transfer flavoprotein subunit beta/FixA family protein [Candidatus Kapabacteria bacterium]
MNILVCVSLVPDTTTRVLVGPDGKSMDPAGVKFILNPYDEFAVEEALRLRDKQKGEVTVISAGSAQAKDAIRQALAMGADKGILVTGEKNDSFQVAEMLAAAIRPLNPDLILLGKQSIDFDGMEIAPMLSELLGLPAATVVVSLAVEGSTAIAEKEIEGGREVIELAMPCIVAAQKGLNDPRYPSLPNIMKAKQKPIQEIVGVPGAARTEIVQMTKPEKRRANKIIKSDGNAAGAAHKLARLLHEEAKVI